MGNARISGAAEKLKARLQGDLRLAMKAKSSNEMKVLRLLISAIDNAEAPPLASYNKAATWHDFRSGSAETARLSLDPAQIRKIIQSEIEEREQSAIELDKAGRPDVAATLREEISIIGRYVA